MRKSQQATNQKLDAPPRTEINTQRKSSNQDRDEEMEDIMSEIAVRLDKDDEL